MKRTAIALVLILSLSLASCSTIRLRYEGEIKDASGKQGTVEFEKSYSVGGGMEIWCGLSAIFFGGACWYYLVLPTVPQKNACRDDANDAIAKKLGSTQFTLDESNVRSVSWSDRETLLDLRWK